VTAVDELKIEKVIDNLISNAIKYSHPEGEIEIKLTSEPNKWMLEVKDHGLGISENARKKLFREFYRGDNVVNSTIVGSGIGLLLVKNYVAMHNGTVSLESKENEGSLFRITIPFKEVTATSPSHAAGAPRNENQTSQLLIKDESIPVNHPDSDQKEQLLIVEDNDVSAAIITTQIQNSGRKRWSGSLEYGAKKIARFDYLGCDDAQYGWF